MSFYIILAEFPALQLIVFYSGMRADRWLSFFFQGDLLSGKNSMLGVLCACLLIINVKGLFIFCLHHNLLPYMLQHYLNII